MFNIMKFNNTTEYRPLTSLVFLLASTIVLAHNGTELILPSTSYDNYDPVEIGGGNDWRDSPTSDYDWRSPEDQPQGRIRYGYDPSYEEMQIRHEQQYNTNRNRSELGDTQAPAQFRIKF
ncbi:MAG: hypothetical protein DRQ39_09405, partial [Gammaproteobacteria bacterium]